jgi:hypothetical protein
VNLVKDLNAWYVNMDAFWVLVMMDATSLCHFNVRRISVSENNRDDEL